MEEVAEEEQIPAAAVAAVAVAVVVAAVAVAVVVAVVDRPIAMWLHRR